MLLDKYIYLNANYYILFEPDKIEAPVGITSPIDYM